METLGQRVLKLRKDKKMSREALGAKIGVSKTAIKNWEDDENAPKLEYLQLLSDYFKCSVEYLTDGTSDGDNFKKIQEKSVRRAPVLNYVQAGEFCEYHDEAISDEFEPVIGDAGDNVYWILLEGDSMEPDFKSGELVLIDPDMQPNPADYVIALRKGEKKVTFKKWRPRGFDENTGEEYSQLIPSNENYPIIDSRFTPFSICGVAVQRNQVLRKS
ncbi:MAG: XRE family transcriptional regulator [Psychrobacter sp.]|tara:strand:- start:22 stop:669 length:648 start_codon:yes stop_codon:yes gene_type:complete